MSKKSNIYDFEENVRVSKANGFLGYCYNLLVKDKGKKKK